MGQIVEFMILKGANQTTIILLLMVPLVATLVSVARHFIGIKSYGIFTPVLLSVAYASISENTKTALVYGLSITFAAIVGSFVLQYILDVNKYKVFRMHYLPKLGIIMTSVAIGLLFMFLIAASLDKSFVAIDPLPFLLIIILAESFSTKAFNKGFRTAFGISIETIILALIGYFVIIFEPLRRLLLDHPEVILLALPINFIVGKFVGLRVSELIRFSDIEAND